MHEEDRIEVAGQDNVAVGMSKDAIGWSPRGAIGPARRARVELQRRPHRPSPSQLCFLLRLWALASPHSA